MSDCTNIVVREQLPDLIHGSLDPQDQSAVQLHLDSCADCAAELALLQAILASRDLVMPVTTTVDVSQIVSALPVYQPRMRVNSHPLRLAAALLIAAVGIATLAITREQTAPETVSQNASVATTSIPATSSSAAVPKNGIALVSVDALSDEQIAELIDEVKTVDPSVSQIDEPFEFDVVGSTAYAELEDI